MLEMKTMPSGKNNIKIIIPIIIIVIGLAVFQFYRKGKVRENFYSGVAEATTYDLAFEIPGKIEKYYVKEGQKVKQGDIMVKMDQDTLLAQLKQMQANLGAARANLANLKAGARPQEIQQARSQLENAVAELTKLKNGPKPQEIQQARSAMLAAQQQYDLYSNGYRKEDIKSAYDQMLGQKSNLENAEKNYRRYLNLYKDEAVAAKDLDYQKNVYQMAKSSYDTSMENYRKLKIGFRPEEKQTAYQQYQASKAAYDNLATGTRYEDINKGEANVRYWKEQVDLLIAGPRPDEVKAAEKKVKEAEAAVDIIKVQLKNSKIYTPVDAVVISKNFEETEMVGSGVPVITAADLEHPWIYIFIPEDQISRYKLGEKAKISLDSFPNKKFDGTISRIYEKSEFTPKFIQTERERVTLVYRVKVAVENPDLVIKPGIPADVEIITGGK